MRAFAMTGIVTASWISLITPGFAIRATPPAARMSAGTRSSAITATAPASSAIPRLTRNVALSAISPNIEGPGGSLLQLESANAVLERRLVTRVDAMGQGLDDRQKGRVG